MRIINKKLSIGILIALIVAMIAPVANASSTVADNVNYRIIDNDCIEIYENGDVNRLSVIRDSEGNAYKVVIKNMNSSEENILTRSEQGITSSVTGQTIKIEPEMTMFAVGDISYKYISFEEIKTALGTAGNITSIAGLILLLCKASSTPVAAVVTILGGITGLVSLVMDGSSSSGLKIKMKETLRKTTKNGKVYTYKSNQIIGISVY